ncbi:MAG: nucleoside deaminase [Lentisphaeria bacterium]|jgi:tRNA(Arg) A34 adenosine deaminase TadA
MDPQFMAEAVRLASVAVRGNDGGPFGAVIVRAGVVLARGWNRVLATADPTAHAEVVAIREACRHLGRFHLEDCELYASCEPCPMCFGAIRWARLRAVYYAATSAEAAAAGFDDAALLAEFARPLAERNPPCIRLAIPEAARPFAEWLAKPDRTPY